MSDDPGRAYPSSFAHLTQDIFKDFYVDNYWAPKSQAAKRIDFNCEGLYLRFYPVVFHF